ncbi:S1C family serine protease [Planctomicrobium piriforme]|uniref:Serine protease Do n=1 Tax=Planctomicrobium piriforme TaxID=1576369 RepID=A0A1I3CCZ4_9PLAN|nr:trypsin-like peptidase domain-containing protein [Planctomicrobium piriforme]SFH72425.1 serine protease Do [Planctomicrobium piriforme]
MIESLRSNLLRLGLGLFTSLCLMLCPAQAEEIHNAIHTVQSRVVKLYGAGGLKNLASYGTGFLVSPDGHIVTVWSHLLDADTVAVVLSDGRRLFGRVIGTDSKKDLAVLKIDATDLPYFDLNQTATASPGAPVLAFSNVFKVAVGDEPVSVMHGIVSAKTDLSARRGRYQLPYTGWVYVVDAVTNNPGAAGGVLTTGDGKLLGVLGREVRSDDNNVWLNYAVPIGELRPTIEDIVAGRFRRTDPLTASTTPVTGGFQPIDFGLVLVPDVVFRTPAYIETVVENSQASKLGLKPDDLIVFANGELIHSLRSLETILRQLTPGDDLQLVVRRGNELVSVTFRVPRQK